MKAKKTWREKLANSKDLPRIQEVTPTMSQRWGTGRFVIPAPMEVDEIMKSVPEGKLTTINQIRSMLAEKHGVNFACPITSGIFAWVAAHAAEEEAAKGMKDITPYWRTLKSGGELNAKYPGGVEEQAKRLAAEGHQIIPGKGKKPPKIKDFEKDLFIRT
ncbi:MAG TPA: MGMT family protein [Dehalococcoidia bacterium]|nr:MGMT family protein [Dehalococcoidia bacterium]